MGSDLGPLRVRHADALERYAAEAGRVPAAAWSHRRPDGGWSAAEVTEHVALGLDAAAREFAGDAPMQLKFSPVMRFVLRYTVFPRMMRTGVFPQGARSPKEMRPSGMRTREESIQRLREADAHLRASLDAALRQGRRPHFTHPYFGRLNVAKGVLMSAVHLEHHTKDMVRAAALAGRTEEEIAGASDA